MSTRKKKIAAERLPRFLMLDSALVWINEEGRYSVLEPQTLRLVSKVLALGPDDQALVEEQVDRRLKGRKNGY
jgi:hypothetical protein